MAKHGLDVVSRDTYLPKAKRRHNLSNEKLERKRASDREAQRALREKTRSHVAHLESLVQSLQGEQDGRIERLIAQLDQQRQEISKLKAALTSISKIAEVAKATGGAESTETISMPQDEPPDDAMNEPDPPDADQSQIMADFSKEDTQEDISDLLPPSDDLSSALLLPEGFHSPNIQSSFMPIESSNEEVDERSSEVEKPQSLSIAQMASSIVRKKDLDGRFWFLAGTLLTFILKNQQGHPTYTAYDEDIAIRAVFDGWSAVIERYPLDRGWQWLKELDENIYFHLSPQHRLMHLRNTRLQLLHQLDPHAGWDQALPAFFAARPSQAHIEHDPLLEHFPWPGLRERILFSPMKFATNHFMDALRKHVHFIWPHDDRDLYVRDAMTGLYNYSSALNRQMMDIRCYTADSKFFDHFPELRQDIPQRQIRPSIALSACMTVDSDSATPSEEGEMSPNRLEIF